MRVGRLVRISQDAGEQLGFPVLSRKPPARWISAMGVPSCERLKQGFAGDQPQNDEQDEDRYGQEEKPLCNCCGTGRDACEAEETSYDGNGEED